MVKPIQSDRLKQKFIKISTKKGGCTMKIFGDELNPSIPYKTFVLSVKDTAEWIVREMLEKYGLKHENSHDYCLIQITIPSSDQDIKEIILHNKDCPLNIYLKHSSKLQESIVFKLIKCPSEYMQIRQQLQIQDRILLDHLPLLIEINNDGTNLPTPQVFKLHPHTTHVGRNVPTDFERQYIYIDGEGIMTDHCILENRDGIVTVIPHGEIWLNGKLLSQPFVLRNRAIICFGKNTIFRYYDQKRITNGNPFSMSTSLPVLSMNQSQPEVLQKRLSTVNAVRPKYGKKEIVFRTKFNVLPGLLEVHRENEIRFLRAVFDHYSVVNTHFRLTPVYTLYMTLRYRLSLYGKSNLSLEQQQEEISHLLYRMENMINQTIETYREHFGYLAYWLANISELVYFIQQDQNLSTISLEIQIRLVKHLQRLFYCLIKFLQNELDKHLVGFTNLRNTCSTIDKIKSTEIRWFSFNQISPQPTVDDLLVLLSSIIDLFCKCRVNPELTIELFSHLFHYINTWLFNRIVCCSELKFCSRYWGEMIALRLQSLQNWALKEGLELLSEYHLLKSNQLCSLLQSPKHDMNDVQQLISTNTLQINSIQIKEILKNYILGINETPISKNFSQGLLSMVDKDLEREGLVIQLEEEIDLNEPFYLPEDGYSCENLRGIPQQLFDFIEPINRLGLCRLFTHSHSLGFWTEFLPVFKKEKSSDRIETIVLNKKNNSLGMNIVSVQNESRQIQGIYIKSIVPGSAAEENGQVQSGDQILRVNQINLRNATQQQATEILKQSGSVVTLQILKHAANHHGLSALLSSSSRTSSPLQSRQNAYYQSKNRPIVIREDIPPSVTNHRQSLSPLQTNGYHDEEISSRSAADEFEEKLKRRLEQFEQERAMERIHIQQMSAKHQADNEARFRRDREREIRADDDLKDFQTQRMSEGNRIIAAKKEQARLLKHMCLPIRKSAK